MIICIKKKSYIRPARHFNKTESLLVIYGSAKAIFFDDFGNIINVIRLGNGKYSKIYYRMNKPIYHTLLIESDYFIFHETTKGPMVRSDTEFSKWSPDESKLEESELFLKKIHLESEKYLKAKI